MKKSIEQKQAFTGVEHPVTGVPYPHPIEELATHLRGGTLEDAHRRLIADVESRDWSKEHLTMSDPDHLKYAAVAMSLGIPLAHGFGNFYAVTHDADLETMRSVNAAKGRALDQVASVFPARSTIETLDNNGQHEIFDFTHLPKGMSPDQAMEMINAFYEIGPFGFRGIASLKDFPHLTKPETWRDGSVHPTIQVIASGYKDEASNDLIKLYSQISGKKVAAITSANFSHTLTQTAEEPAHWKIHGIQSDFGNRDRVGFPFIMLGHHNESENLAKYPYHSPKSTSVIGFHRDPEGLPVVSGRPTVTLERQGSLPLDRIVEVLNKVKVNLFVPEEGQVALGERNYPPSIIRGSQEAIRRRRARWADVPQLNT